MGYILGYSEAAVTTDEGASVVFEISGGNFKESYIVHPTSFSSSPATNNDIKHIPSVFMPWDQPVSGGELITAAISNTGGTQTGAFEGHVGVVYRDHGSIPPDILARMPGLVAPKRGVFEYDLVTDAVRAVLDAHGGAALEGKMTIPAEAKEVCGMLITMAKDGAVTAAENMDGYIDLVGASLGQQEYPMPSWLPGIGTEVSGVAPGTAMYYPMHLPTTKHLAYTIQAYANLDTAVGADVQVTCNLYWR